MMQFSVVLLLFLGIHVIGAADKQFQERSKRQTSPLKVTTIKEDPYTMSHGSEFEGFCMDILKYLSNKLGFEYSVQLVKDNAYGRQDVKGNWNGMIGEVVRNEADLAVAPLTITAAREKSIELSKPFMQTGIGIILKKNDISSGPNFFEFLNPFSKETWIGILIAYASTSICLFIVARLSPCQWNEPKNDENQFTFMNSLWYAIGALTLQGAGPQPKAFSVRVISGIWWLFSVALLASYIANFSSILGTNSAKLTIETFDDLVKQDVIEYGTMQYSSTLNFLKTSKHPTYQMIYDHIERRKTTVPSMDEGIRKAREGKYAFIGESVSLDLAVARHCDLVRVPEVIGMRGYGIAGPKDSPFVKNLSIAILEMSESGDLDYLREKWWASTCETEGQDGRLAPLRPHQLGGIFVLLTIGLILGVILALMELAFKSRHSAADKKKSCCSIFLEELSQRFQKSDGKKKCEAQDKSNA
ncbi:probable glutamate receptor [Polypterus senegalus]|uniref:probable glutamate receptor n=1 Tax=Polypterus senegalus TaxID=55291 RepID=UPI001964D7D2|nr:probable glutamate receptor [Polypterus senegalus]